MTKMYGKPMKSNFVNNRDMKVALAYTTPAPPPSKATLAPYLFLTTKNTKDTKKK